MSEEHKREFTEEQLRAGEGHIGLQAGYNKGATQSGINIGKPRSVHDWTCSSHSVDIHQQHYDCIALPRLSNIEQTLKFIHKIKINYSLQSDIHKICHFMIHQNASEIKS